MRTARCGIFTVTLILHFSRARSSRVTWACRASGGLGRSLASFAGGRMMLIKWRKAETRRFVRYEHQRELTCCPRIFLFGRFT